MFTTTQHTCTYVTCAEKGENTARALVISLGVAETSVVNSNMYGAVKSTTDSRESGNIILNPQMSYSE